MYEHAITINTAILNKVIQHSEHNFTSLDKSATHVPRPEEQKLQMYNFIKHLFAM